MPETAVILAGGFGTRLQAVVSDVPKPMAPVNGTPFLSYQLRYLKNFGVRQVVLSVGHLANVIMDHYRSYFEGITISYSHELSPLGTGGGVRMALQQCAGKDVLVLNGDSFFDVDLEAFSSHYTASGAVCALALRRVANAARYGTIDLGPEKRILSFREKTGVAAPGLINGGIYLLKKDIYLQLTPENTPFSIEKDFFEKYADQLLMTGFESAGYFIDIGIPDDYQKAQHEFKGFKYQ